MTVSSPLVIVSHSRYREHDTGGGIHPEVAERYDVIRHLFDGLQSAGKGVFLEAKPAERSWVLAVHAENYLLRLEEAALSGKSWLAHPDNRMCYATYEVAMLAAGAAPTAIDYLERGGAGRAFCLVRPPGHHAEPSLPLGFCFLNNVAVAARYWQRRHGRRKIAVVDFDAHHGNGIQAIFEEDPDVFYASIHEHPTFSFPGTGFAEERGSGAGVGATLNLPLLPGVSNEAFKKTFCGDLLPAIESFRPEALLVAAGFDGHVADDMSGLTYSSLLYGFIGSRLAQVADRLCGGRMVSVLEGGYNLQALAESVAMYWRGLAMPNLEE